MPGRAFWLVKDVERRVYAQSMCESGGGRLASLNTLKTFDFVTNWLGSFAISKWVWIGGECVGCSEVTEDNWKWTSGDPLSKNNPMWGIEFSQSPSDNG